MSVEWKVCAKCSADFETEDDADFCPACEGAMIGSRPRSASVQEGRIRNIRSRETGSGSDDYRHHPGLTTTQFVSPEDVKRTLGTVTATIVRGPGFFGQLGVDFSDMLGGRSSKVEALFDDLYSEVMARLFERAVKSGGTAVIGVDFSIQEFGNKLFVVSAAGTAVITG